MKFEGTSDYIATEDLRVAVNAAIVLERPLLIKGEPGTGKTVLAHEVARALETNLLEWHIKSTTKAQQGLYEYDAVSRLRDSQLGRRARARHQELHQARQAVGGLHRDKRPVLLIDEIDKADIEFPNDLLQELDRMEFHVYETGETIKADARPVVIITSNNEKELPDAFLRRCFFHFIKFPDAETMRDIIEVHFPGMKGRLVNEALNIFYQVRDVPGLKKKPSTSELLDWIKLLLNEDVTPETLRQKDPTKVIPPLHGRCSRTSRTWPCSNASPSWPVAKGANPANACTVRCGPASCRLRRSAPRSFQPSRTHLARRCQRQTWPCLPARCGCNPPLPAADQPAAPEALSCTWLELQVLSGLPHHLAKVEIAREHYIVLRFLRAQPRGHWHLPCRQCSSRAAFHTDAELSFDCAAVPLFQYLDALTERAQPANVGEPQPVSRHICKLGRFRQLKSSITASAHFFEHKLL
jgi:MoxR-like ATPase